MILAHPQNYHCHTKYAEVLYTIGGYDNYKLARKYFAASYELNQESNARALYGLIAVSSFQYLAFANMCYVQRAPLLCSTLNKARMTKRTWLSLNSLSTSYSSCTKVPFVCTFITN